MKKRSLALFDFDGTITTRETFLPFMRFFAGTFKFYFGMATLIPWAAAYFLRIIDAAQMKEKITIYFLGGTREKVLHQKAKEFADIYFPKVVKNEAVEKIKFHKERGDRVFLVSATFSFYLKYFTELHEMELAATEIEVKDGIVTGKLGSVNCKGIEKVNRVKNAINGEKFDEIFAYGDTSGDREMLAFATRPHYRVFKK